MSKKDFSVALKYVDARPRSQRRKGTEARVSGISVVGSGASATDLSLLQANLISVTNNFTALKDLFDSMFEKDSDGNIHVKLSLWSSGGITAGGVGSGSSGGGGGISYSRLDSWADYSADKAGYVLSALLGKDLDNRASALANAGYITASYLAPYALRSEIPSLAGYASQSWVGENFLSKNGGTVNGSITANSFIGNLTGNADSADFVAKTYANENINFARDESKIRLVSGVASNSTDLGFPKQYTAGLSVVSSYCGWQMVCYGSNIDYNPYYRSVTDKGVWGYWRQIAFLTDNVASATKLQTARTIWGQSFDGTENITGTFRLLNKDSYNGGVAHSILNHSVSPYGLLTRIYGSGAVSLQSQRETTTSEYFHLYLNPLGGNVAIGATIANEKLHVYGNGKFTGVLLSQALRSAGIYIGCDASGVASDNYTREINTYANKLYLQYRGGDLDVCGGGGTTYLGGALEGKTANFTSLTAPAITTNTLKVGNVTLVEENGALKVIGGLIATGGVTSGEKAS